MKKIFNCHSLRGQLSTEQLFLEQRIVFKSKAEVARGAAERAPKTPESTIADLTGQTELAAKRRDTEHRNTLRELTDVIRKTELVVYTGNIDDPKLKTNIERGFEQKSQATFNAVDAWAAKYKMGQQDLLKFVNRKDNSLLADFFKAKDTSAKKTALSNAGARLATEWQGNPQSDAQKIVEILFDVDEIKKTLGDAAAQELIAIFKASFETTKELIAEEPALTRINATPEERKMWEAYKNITPTDLQKKFTEKNILLPEQTKIAETLRRVREAIKETKMDPTIAEELEKGGFIATLSALIERIVKLMEHFGAQFEGLFGKKESPETETEKPSSIFSGGAKMIITSDIGHRDIQHGRDNHPGLDIRVADQPMIYAPLDGEVTPGSSGGHGNYVDLKLADGRVIRFAHLKSTAVRPGPIKAGDVLGETGSTGISTGPHVHIEMRDGGGKFLNVMAFFSEHLQYADTYKEASKRNQPATYEDSKETQEFLDKFNEWRALWVSLGFGGEKTNFTDEDVAKISIKLAKEIEKKHKIPWQVTAAQCLLESGWGKSTPGQNYFGIKASQGITAATREVINGKEQQTTATFAEHGSMQASFEAYTRVVTGERYRDAFNHTADPKRFAAIIAEKGYATDPKYAARVAEVINRVETINKTIGNGGINAAAT